MLVCKGIGAKKLFDLTRGKLIDIPLLSCCDNIATLTIRDKDGKVFTTIPNITGKFHTPATYWVRGWRTGIDMYIAARVVDGQPPVTGENPCGLYLYNNYHKKTATFVSGLYCKAGRAAAAWYNGPAWFMATSNGNQNGKFDWVFKFTVPIEF